MRNETIVEPAGELCYHVQRWIVTSRSQFLLHNRLSAQCLGVGAYPEASWYSRDRRRFLVLSVDLQTLRWSGRFYRRSLGRCYAP